MSWKQYVSLMLLGFIGTLHNIWFLSAQFLLTAFSMSNLQDGSIAATSWEFGVPLMENFIPASMVWDAIATKHD